MNLPDKTIRTLRYALSASAQFTHVLKTDEDCYVRMRLVLEAIYDRYTHQPRMEKVKFLRRYSMTAVQTTHISVGGGEKGQACSGCH